MKKQTVILFALATTIVFAWYRLTDKKTAITGALDVETLIVGTSGDYPPFSFIKNNEYVGFEIDVAREIARRLGKKIFIKDMPFTTLIPELQMGKISMIAAGMTFSPERAKRVAFTRPHFTGDPLVIVTRVQDKIATLEDVRGKEVVVNEGYTADNYVTEWGGSPIVRLMSPADAFLALKSGRAFAYIDAKAAVMPFFQQYGAENFSMMPIPGTGSTIALGFSLKDPKFTEQVQAILNAMQAAGTLDTLKKKWNLI